EKRRKAAVVTGALDETEESEKQAGKGGSSTLRLSEEELQASLERLTQRGKTRACPPSARDFNDWKRKNGVPEDAKVFVLTGWYPCVKKALLDRGWVQNNDRDSPFFDLKWTLHSQDIRATGIKPWQLCNHFFKNVAITTKAGLLGNLRNLKWFANTDSKEVFPRGYNLSIETDMQASGAFLDDYCATAAESLLKHVFVRSKGKEALRSLGVDYEVQSTTKDYQDKVTGRTDNIVSSDPDSEFSSAFDSDWDISDAEKPPAPAATAAATMFGISGNQDSTDGCSSHAKETGSTRCNECHGFRSTTGVEEGKGNERDEGEPGTGENVGLANSEVETGEGPERCRHRMVRHSDLVILLPVEGILLRRVNYGTPATHSYPLVHICKHQTKIREDFETMPSAAKVFASMEESNTPGQPERHSSSKEATGGNTEDRVASSDGEGGKGYEYDFADPNGRNDAAEGRHRRGEQMGGGASICGDGEVCRETRPLDESRGRSWFPEGHDFMVNVEILNAAISVCRKRQHGPSPTCQTVVEDDYIDEPSPMEPIVSNLEWELIRLGVGHVPDPDMAGMYRPHSLPSRPCTPVEAFIKTEKSDAAEEAKVSRLRAQRRQRKRNNEARAAAEIRVQEVEPLGEARLKEVRQVLKGLKSAYAQFDLNGDFCKNVWIVKPAAKSRGRGIE
ncbi:unnamed protein product, partial [Discosporangium mesarthrocarpum]